MEQLVVKHTFNLEDNMQIVKQSIIDEITKYDVVVTDETVQDSKKIMAQINKDKKLFTDKCKAFLDVIEKPIKTFKDQKKEIENLYSDARLKISSQVEKYDAERLIRIKFVINEYKSNQCEIKEINNESIVIDDLVILSAVTNKNVLTTKTKQAVDARVQAVENQILEEKLEAEKKAQREKEIEHQARIKALEEAKKKEIEILKQAEIEKKEAIQKARIEALKEAVEQRNPEMGIIEKETVKEEQNVEVDENGKRVFTINAQFKIKAPINTEHNDIADKIKSILKKVGIDAQINGVF